MGIIVDNKKSASKPLLNSYLENIKEIFQKRYLITFIDNQNEINDIKNIKLLIVIGNVPIWFRNYKNKYPLIHFIADKYCSKFFQNRPVDKFNRFIARGMLKEIYNETFLPEIILVHNKKMKSDFEELIDFYKPNVYTIPYYTDKFNSSLRDILNLKIENNIKPYFLYNSTNLLNSKLLKRSITKSEDYKIKDKFIIYKPYNKKQITTLKKTIVAILNYRYNTKDHVEELYPKFFKKFIFYLCHILYLFYFSVKNIDLRKDNIFSSLLEIINSFLIDGKGIHHRWKPATKLQLSAGLFIPLITQSEESTIYQNFNNYPVYYYANYEQLEFIYHNTDWKSKKKICEIKGKELLEIYRNSYRKIMLNIEKIYCIK